MDIYYIPQNKKKMWEIQVEFSNHCQMRWMDRKVPSRAINTMVGRVINFCFSKKRSLKKRIVVRNFRRKCSLVAAMTKYDEKNLKIGILVVTVLRAIMRVSEGETIIDIMTDGREKVYENKNENRKRQMENKMEYDEPCSGTLHGEENSRECN